MPDSSLSRVDQLEAALRLAAKARAPDRLHKQLAQGCFMSTVPVVFGRRVADLLHAQGYSCLGIIDLKASETATELDGISLFHPDRLTPALCSGRVLVLGIFNPYHDMGEVVRAMRLCGFANILWGADLPDALGPSFDDFWLSGRQFLLDHFSRIREADAVFADETSRQTFERSVIRFRALDGDQPSPKLDLWHSISAARFTWFRQANQFHRRRRLRRRHIPRLARLWCQHRKLACF